MEETRKPGRADNGGSMKAVVYCRVASATVAEKDMALLSQEIRCRAYAAEKGYDVLKVVHDWPASGARFDRNGVRELLQYLVREKHQSPDVVIVDDITRLARSHDVYLDFRRALEAADVKLECSGAGIGSDLVDRQPETARKPQRDRGPQR